MLCFRVDDDREFVFTLDLANPEIPINDLIRSRLDFLLKYKNYPAGS